jgi:hypothetical protein
MEQSPSPNTTKKGGLLFSQLNFNVLLVIFMIIQRVQLRMQKSVSNLNGKLIRHNKIFLCYGLLFYKHTYLDIEFR